MASNVLGGNLEQCCLDPVTGYYRNGKCDTGKGDHGMHCVCVEMTDEFLQFAKSQGNDLITPMPENEFPGLESGNKWCVCIGTVVDAIASDVNTKIVLKSTHISVKEFLDMDVLLKHGIDA
ncbi:MAG: hypothetical protein COA79_15155 [Planctomycetota bacterium]|nr:MAG: hypothetical protein COA79_15155 [Planctomycetota bacterium]